MTNGFTECGPIICLAPPPLSDQGKISSGRSYIPKTASREDINQLGDSAWSIDFYLFELYLWRGWDSPRGVPSGELSGINCAERVGFENTLFQYLKL